MDWYQPSKQMKPYHKTPLELQQVIELFHRHHLNYNLFKCEHIFEGDDKNLDILLKEDQDYTTASFLLEQEGFCLFLDENIEKFKKMYVCFKNGFLTAIHLHREIAWHGVKFLDKKNIFAKSRELENGIFVPSIEDSILIHTAHVIAENFAFRQRELKFLPLYLQQNPDWRYITKMSADSHWKIKLKPLLEKIPHQNISKTEIVKTYFNVLLNRPVDCLYLGKKVIMHFLKKIYLRRKGTLIALIGVNGAGKTTLATKIGEKYQPLARFMGVQQKYYYYGWQPFSPLAKLGATVFRKKDIFKKATAEDNKHPQKVNLVQEALFFYNYLDYFLRYLFHIYPSLRRGNLVVSDRYCYDLYGQYPAAEKSIILKTVLRLFPQPDYTFILDAPLESLLKREKQDEKRTVKPAAYLQGQRERYLQLKNVFPESVIINTEKNVEENVLEIINKSWPGIIQKLNH